MYLEMHGNDDARNGMRLDAINLSQNHPSMTRVLEMLQPNLDDLEMHPKPILAQYLHEIEAESDSPKEMLLPETMKRSS
ncbi:hypothetical protein V6N11_083476 [Hibiscus sabdariffa]|uniref:Uncharacterized protein n=1 Tax=Hibiscus sabdariffa TaxID=183260 RepID=A0ABR2QM46_9ROSI